MSFMSTGWVHAINWKSASFMLLNQTQFAMYISLVTQAVPRKNYEYIKNIQFGLMTRIGCRGSDGCLIYDRCFQ
jgi:hypothetical protein